MNEKEEIFLNLLAYLYYNRIETIKDADNKVMKVDHYLIAKELRKNNVVGFDNKMKRVIKAYEKENDEITLP